MYFLQHAMLILSYIYYYFGLMGQRYCVYLYCIHAFNDATASYFKQHTSNLRQVGETTTHLETISEHIETSDTRAATKTRGGNGRGQRAYETRENIENRWSSQNNWRKQQGA